MATLNGAEFKIIEAEWSTYQNNVIQEILGSDTVEVQNQGHGSEPVRIQGMVNNEKEMNDFQEQFYSNGALTFIKDPDSGRQYQVYALGNVRRENITNSLLDQGIIFTCMMQLRYPYSESVDTITRSKSISTQNQEWSADDDSIDIKTEGNVDAVPDIQVVGGYGYDHSLASDIEYTAPSIYPSGLTWDGTNIWSCDADSDKIYKHNADMTVNTEYAAPSIYPTGLTWDGTNIWSCDASTYKIYKHNADMTVNTTYDSPGSYPRGLAWDGTNIWSCDVGTEKIYKHNTDMTINTSYDSPSTEPRGLTWDGTNIWSCDTASDKIYKHDTDLTVDIEYSAPSTEPRGLTWDGFNLWSCDGASDKIYKHVSKIRNTDIDVYNTADSTVKCSVGNEILYSAIHRINADGTGTIDFDDDFSTTKYESICTTLLNVTLDGVNNELDIADDGYIYWKIDPKFPINGIPILTSRIDIISGTPTIQISTDASTWHDIDTAIVDDVETEYPLDSDGNLSLAGKTLFYFRYDCVKAAAATCSIKYFELDIAMHTIYAKNPKIPKGSSPSTFRIDQDTDSSMVCTVDLIYRNRWWV